MIPTSIDCILLTGGLKTQFDTTDSLKTLRIPFWFTGYEYRIFICKTSVFFEIYFTMHAKGSCTFDSICTNPLAGCESIVNVAGNIKLNLVKLHQSGKANVHYVRASTIFDERSDQKTKQLKLIEHSGEFYGVYNNHLNVKHKLCIWPTQISMHNCHDVCT